MITKEMKEMFVKTAIQIAEDIIDCGGTINAGCADVAAQMGIPGFWEAEAGKPHVGGALDMGRGCFNTLALYDGVHLAPVCAVYEAEINEEPFYGLFVNNGPDDHWFTYSPNVGDITINLSSRPYPSRGQADQAVRESAITMYTIKGNPDSRQAILDSLRQEWYG